MMLVGATVKRAIDERAASNFQFLETVYCKSSRCLKCPLAKPALLDSNGSLKDNRKPVDVGMALSASYSAAMAWKKDYDKVTAKCSNWTTLSQTDDDMNWANSDVFFKDLQELS
eukprot:2689341-Amphidinium_carterae.1